MKKENVYKQLRESTETNDKPALTQGELAAIFESEGNPLSQSVISKLENQKKEPPTTSLDVLKAYAVHFNVTTDYLLGLRNTSSLDENIVMINKVTGLSESAISTLKKLNANGGCTFVGHNEINTLNFLLSNHLDAAELLTHIQDYLFASHKIPVFHTGKQEVIDGILVPECIVPDNAYDVMKIGNKEMRLLSLAKDKNKAYDNYQIPLDDTFFEGIALKAIEKKLRDYLEILNEKE